MSCLHRFGHISTVFSRKMTAGVFVSSGPFSYNLLAAGILVVVPSPLRFSVYHLRIFASQSCIFALSGLAEAMQPVIRSCRHLFVCILTPRSLWQWMRARGRPACPRPRLPLESQNSDSPSPSPSPSPHHTRTTKLTPRRCRPSFEAADWCDVCLVFAGCGFLVPAAWTARPYPSHDSADTNTIGPERVSSYCWRRCESSFSDPLTGIEQLAMSRRCV